MAITPRTILTSAAPATVAVISLYVFTALGTMAYKSTRDVDESRFRNANRVVHQIHISGNDQSCSHIPDAFGADTRVWSENAWITYVACFHYQQDSEEVISIAAQGLKYYPRSETLYNVMGEHQIISGQPEEAVHTLRTGMRNVPALQNGMMPNNLAWAGLMVPRTMSLDEARMLYQQALTLDPNSCEQIHTALWVEYAFIRNSTGVENLMATERFNEIHQMYEPCITNASRVHQADLKTLGEVIGATTIISDVAEQQTGSAQIHHSGLVATKLLIERHPDVSFDSICAEAMPLAETHQKCVEHLQTNVRVLNQSQRMHHRHQTSRAHSKKSTHCGGISR